MNPVTLITHQSTNRIPLKGQSVHRKYFKSTAEQPENIYSSHIKRPVTTSNKQTVYINFNNIMFMTHGLLLQRDKEEGAAKNSRKSGSFTIRVQKNPPAKQRTKVLTNDLTSSHCYLYHHHVLVLKSVFMLVHSLQPPVLHGRTVT